MLLILGCSTNVETGQIVRRSSLRARLYSAINVRVEIGYVDDSRINDTSEW